DSGARRWAPSWNASCGVARRKVASTSPCGPTVAVTFKMPMLRRLQRGTLSPGL
ncbi:unnamed protein product, partial [Symbiodinium microadriaticum]